MRFAPGTMASMAALPLHLLLANAIAPWMEAVVLLVLASMGTWAAGRVQVQLGTDDPQCVVVDEFVGAGIAYLVAGLDPAALLVAFTLFRVLDIFKPWPINWCEALEPPGFGIMADDLAAGLLAAAGTLAFVHLKASLLIA